MSGFQLELLNPPPPPALGPFLIPDAWWCPTARAFYQAEPVVSAPGIVQIKCPHCDQYGRTGAARDAQLAEVHTYSLEPADQPRPIRRMGRVIQRWDSN